MDLIMLQRRIAASVQASWKMSHLLFHCPVYSAIRQKHIAELTEKPRTLNQLLETPPTLLSRNVALYTLYALKFREQLLA